MKSDSSVPTFVFDDLPLHWQMTRCEKYAFGALLHASKPEVAIEIGTFQGGSLQVLSSESQKVYSLDISDDCREKLGAHFPNVEFLTGDSRVQLPALLKKLQVQGDALGFVLIDGNHSTEYVRADINNVLTYTPVRPLHIIFHDSFNPDCRAGILSAAWQKCPYVHYVEVDFVPGVFHYDSRESAQPKSMWGGLACALMLPEPRKHPLTIHQSQKGLFDVVFSASCHSDVNSGLHESAFCRLKRMLTPRMTQNK